MSELEIITNCQKGDLKEFDKLYEMYINKVYQFIYFKTYHKETAEDLTAVTFMKALEKIQTFDAEKASFKTWLYQIARNTVTDHYRTSREIVDIEDVWDLSTQEDIAKDISHKIQIEEVQQYLQKLKPEQREIVLLRVWGGHSFQEIAEIMDKSEASCKMMFKRTIEKLRINLVVLYFLIFFI